MMFSYKILLFMVKRSLYQKVHNSSRSCQ